MSLSRLNLVAYRSASVTPDLAEALRQTEARAAAQPGARLLLSGPAPSEPSLSLARAGREIRIRLELRPKPLDPVVELGFLWGILVPMGFTPKNRYPIPGPDDDVFHFFGPWQGLLDYFCGEGRGDLAWPAACCAAQVDVGTWEGERPTERFVQAQLHRLGLHCGPLDGVITDSVTSALRALGITGKTLEETADTLSKYRTPPVSVSERRTGHVIVPGDDLSVVSYGKITTSRTQQGVALTIDGPGRVVINFGNGDM